MGHERARRVAAFRDEGGEIDVADRGARRLVVRQGALQAPDMAEREDESPGRGGERRMRFRVHRFGFRPRRLALERVDGELMVGRQNGATGGQELQAQVLEIERPDPQRVADSRQHCRGLRCLPDEVDVALGGHQRIQRIEQDADRRCEPHPLALFSRPIKQDRARRLQLLRKHRLLANRRAIGRSQFLVRIKNARDRAHVDREFADRFARDQPAGAGVGKDGRQKRKRDIGDAPAREQQLDSNRGRESLARESENENHRDDRLHADRHRPSAEPGDETADKADEADHDEGGDRPGQRELDRHGREERQREAEAERLRLLPPGRREIGNAGRYGAERRRLAGGEAENRRGDKRDRNHPQADARAVDDVLADEEPQQIGWARPARHGARKSPRRPSPSVSTIRPRAPRSH